MRERDVASVMTTRVVTTAPETPFKELVALMSDNRVSAVPVVNTLGRPIGVVSEADVLAKQEFHGGRDLMPSRDRAGRDRWFRALAQVASELMTSPVRTVAADAPVALAARELARAQVRRLFVVDDAGRLVGVVSRRDLLRVYLLADEEIRAEVEELLASAVGAAADTAKVTVSAGVTTVDGVLQRRRQVEAVSRLVPALPGVVSVHNNLRYVIDDLTASGWTGFSP